MEKKTTLSSGFLQVFQSKTGFNSPSQEFVCTQREHMLIAMESLKDWEGSDLWHSSPP